MSQIKHINLSDLILPEFESHKNIPEEHISEMTSSIKAVGIIEPLIVRPKNEHFEIIAGCLRYHSALLAGLKAAPCIIIKADDKAAEILKIHENMKRLDLDHIDQGNTFVMMQQKFSLTEQDISNLIGKSVPYISQHISLVSQDDELIQAVRDNKISFSQARELMRVPDLSERRRLQSYCENDGATIQTLKNWIREYEDSLIKNPPSSSSPAAEVHYSETPQDLRPCAACDKHVELKDIRQVFYCPECYLAIKLAISEEKAHPTQKNTDSKHTDAP